MKVRFAWSLICLVLLWSPGAFAQKSDEITPSEAKEALELAHRFVDGLVTQKDFDPLVRKYFVPGFEKRLPDVALTMWPAGLKRTAHVRKNMRALYVAQMNFLSLTALYMASQPESSQGNDESFYASMPRDIALEMNSAGDLWERMDSDAESRPLSVAKTNREFDARIALLKRISVRLRGHVDHLTPQSPEIQMVFKPQSMSGYKTFDTWEYTCEKRCYLDLRFPKGTRLIIVELPLLQQAVLVADRGKLRVVAVMLAD